MKFNKINIFKFFALPIISITALTSLITLTSCSNKNTQKTAKQNAMDALKSLENALAIKLFFSTNFQTFAREILNEDFNAENDKGTLYDLVDFLTSSNGIHLNSALNSSSMIYDLVELGKKDGIISKSKTVPGPNDNKWNQLITKIQNFGKKVLDVQTFDSTLILTSLYETSSSLSSLLEYGSLKIQGENFDFIQKDLSSQVVTSFEKLCSNIEFPEGIQISITGDTTLAMLNSLLYNSLFYSNETLKSVSKSNDLLAFAISYTELMFKLQQNRSAYENAQHLASILASMPRSNDTTIFQASFNNHISIASNLENSLNGINSEIHSINDTKIDTLLSYFFSTTSLLLNKSINTPTEKWEALEGTLSELISSFEIYNTKQDTLDNIYEYSLPYLMNIVDVDTFKLSQALVPYHPIYVYDLDVNYAVDDFVAAYNELTQGSLYSNSSFKEAFLSTNSNGQKIISNNLQEAIGTVQEWKKLNTSFAKFISFNAISSLYNKPNIDKEKKLVSLLENVPQGFSNLVSDINPLIDEKSQINNESTLQDLFNLIKQDASLVKIPAFGENAPDSYKWTNLATTLIRIIKAFNQVNFYNIDIEDVKSSGEKYVDTTSTITITFPQPMYFSSDTIFSNKVHVKANGLNINTSSVVANKTDNLITSITITLNDDSNLWRQDDLAYISIDEIHDDSNFYHFNISPVLLNKQKTGATLTLSSDSSSSEKDTNIITLSSSVGFNELEKEDFINKVHLQNTTQNKEIHYPSSSLFLSSDKTTINVILSDSWSIEHPQWKEGDSVQVSVDDITKNSIKYSFEINSCSSITFHKTPILINTPIITNNGKIDETDTTMIVVELPNSIRGLTNEILNSKISISNTTQTSNSITLGNIIINDGKQLLLPITSVKNWHEGDICEIEISNFEANGVAYSIPKLTTTLHSSPSNIAFTYATNGSFGTENTNSITLTFPESTSKLSVKPTRKVGDAPTSDVPTLDISITNNRTKLPLTSEINTSTSNTITVSLTNASEWKEGDSVDIKIKNIRCDNVLYSFTSLTNPNVPLLHKQATTINFSYTTDGTSTVTSSRIVSINFSNIPTDSTFDKKDFENKIHIKNTTKNKELSFTLDSISGNTMKLSLLSPNEWTNSDKIAVTLDSFAKDNVAYVFNSNTSNDIFLWKQALNESFEATSDGEFWKTTDTKITISLKDEISSLSSSILTGKIHFKNIVTGSELTQGTITISNNKEIMVPLSNSNEWKNGDNVEVKIDDFNIETTTYKFSTIAKVIMHQVPTEASFTASFEKGEIKWDSKTDHFLKIQPTNVYGLTKEELTNKIHMIGSSSGDLSKDLDVIEVDIDNTTKKVNTITLAILTNEFINGETMTISIDDIYSNSLNNLYYFSSSLQLSISKANEVINAYVLTNGTDSIETSFQITVKLLTPIIGLKKTDLESKYTIKNVTRNALNGGDNFINAAISSVTSNEITFNITNSSQWDNGDEFEIVFEDSIANSYQINILEYQPLYKVATIIDYTITIDGAKDSSNTTTIVFNDEYISINLYSLNLEVKNKTRNTKITYEKVFDKTVNYSRYYCLQLPNSSEWKEGDEVSISFKNHNIKKENYSFRNVNSKETLLLHKAPNVENFSIITSGSASSVNTTNIRINNVFISQNLNKLTFEVKNKTKNTTITHKVVQPQGYDSNNPIIYYIQLPYSSEWKEGDEVIIDFSPYTDSDGITHVFNQFAIGTLHKKIINEIIYFTAATGNRGDGYQYVNITLPKKIFDETKDQKLLNSLKIELITEDNTIITSDIGVLIPTMDDEKQILTFTIARNNIDYDTVINKVNLSSLIIDEVNYSFIYSGAPFKIFEGY